MMRIAMEESLNCAIANKTETHGAEPETPKPLVDIIQFIMPE